MKTFYSNIKYSIKLTCKALFMLLLIICADWACCNWNRNWFVSCIEPIAGKKREKKSKSEICRKVYALWRSLLKIAMLILAIDMTVSISLGLLTVTKYITMKRLPCGKVGKGQTHKLQNISQSISMTQVSKNQPPAPKTILLTRTWIQNGNSCQAP